MCGLRFGTLWKPILLALLVWLVWMDVCLYLNIQSLANEERPLHFDNKETNLNTKQGKVVSNERQQQDLSNNIGHHTNGSANWLLALASKFSYAFNGLSLKLMMTDPIDNYIMGPLSELFASWCNFEHRFHFISANMVSYTGVISALIAAKLVTYKRPSLHKLSVLFFQLRTWLDDLDGVVARSRLGITKHVSLTGTPGYIMDGVCDAIGFVAYTIGCYIYLRNITNRPQPERSLGGGRPRSTPGRKLQSFGFSNNLTDELVPLKQAQSHPDGREDGTDSTSESDGERKGKPDDHSEQTRFSVRPHEDGRDQTPKQSNLISSKQLIVTVSCFLLQLLMCSALWNRYILVYRDLLESPSSSIVQVRAKRQILKSNVMFIIIWFWRLTNGHFMMQMLAASIFSGKLWQFLNFIKYIGFIEIASLATLTELHIIDVKNYLNDVAG